MSTTPLAVTPPWPLLRVVGPDAASWLNGIVTCDTTQLVPGQALWGLVLSKTGKAQAELLLVGSSTDLWIVVSGGDPVALEATLQHYLVMEDAELLAAPEVAVLCVYGATTSTAAEPLVSARLPEGQGTLTLGPRTAIAEQLDALIAEGARRAEASTEWDERRLELGIPAFGVDYGDRDNPHEAGLDRRAVSWSKGCYLGQEVVCMQDMRGRVKRRLARLEPVGAVPSWEAGSLVNSDSAEGIGRVTTAGRGLALATLTAPWFEEGQVLRVLGEPVRVLPLSPG